jgi:hypothetical protein
VALGFGVSTFTGVVYSGMVFILLCLENEDRSLPGLWRTLSPVLAKLVWVSLIVAAGVSAGLILLIVPGLILLTLWIVSMPVVVVEQPGVLESLSRSRELVRGNGLRTFLFLLVLGMLIFFAAMLGALISLPFGTGPAGAAAASFIITAAVNPLTAIGPAALYNVLAADEAGAGPAGDASLTRFTPGEAGTLPDPEPRPEQDPPPEPLPEPEPGTRPQDPPKPD